MSAPTDDRPSQISSPRSGSRPSLKSSLTERRAEPLQPRRDALTRLLESAPPTSPLRRAARLLKGPEPSERRARLDTALGLLRAHRRRIDAALIRLDDAAARALNPLGLSTSDGLAAPHAAQAVDGLLRSLVKFCVEDARGCADATARPSSADAAPLIDLVLAVARLGEDAAGLEDRHRRSPGTGFEDLLDRRLRGRLPRVLDAPHQVAQLDQRLAVLMQDPDAGLAALLAAAPELDHDDARDWIEAERRAAILRFVRRDKTDGEGHIRHHVEVDERGRPVLVRLGARGWWRAPIGELELCLRHAAAVEDGRLCPSEATPLRALAPDGDLLAIDRARASSRSSGPATELRLEPGPGPLGLRLVRGERTVFPAPEDSKNPVGKPAGEQAREPASATRTGLTLELLNRIEALGSRCVISDEAAATAPGALCRTLQSRVERDPRGAGRRVRLVYVPSELPHPLGGVPELGLAILDRVLSERGDRVLRLMIRAREFDDRLPELLTADIVGIGVYVHNREEVAVLVRQLRAADYRGQIVLGGPECRSIEAILRDFDGFDAVIRGEAEDVLPEVLESLALIDEARLEEAALRALNLRGVVLRVGDELWLCDTAHRSRASVVRAPRPLLWSADGRLKLKVNVSRGCPYLCTFCPNHQGRAFRAGPVEELVEVLIDAVADHRRLPAELQRELHERLSVELKVLAADRDTELHEFHALPLAALVHVAARVELSPDFHRALTAIAERTPAGDPLPARAVTETSKADLNGNGTRGADSRVDRDVARDFGQAWLDLKRRHGLAQSSPRFVIETSEDNTLVNRATVLTLLERRRELGLASEVLFNPGQNTIRDLLGPDGSPDEGFLDALVADNPFEVAFGTDATSPAVLRQNRKPNATISQVLAVNRALARRGIRAVNNTILLSAETTLLEAIESLLLWRLLPLPWRDYGPAINLRVIKEETTLATDEGRLLFPEDKGWDVPLRDPATTTLIERLGLSAMMTAEQAAGRIDAALTEDPDFRAHLPLLLERWSLDLDGEPELRALATLIRREQSRIEPPMELGLAFLALIGRLRAEALDELGTRRTPSELASGGQGSTRDTSSV